MWRRASSSPSSQCGMPPTTSAPSVIASAISSSVPGSRQMPSCGKATSWISHRSAWSSRAAATPRSPFRPPMVSTSTWLRIAVVPAITAARMTSPARARISSTLAARLTACEIEIASASVPERFGPSSGPVRTLSRWMCGCTNAGRTRRPPASSTGPSSPVPSSAIRSPAIPMSTRAPSTRASWMTRS